MSASPWPDSDNEGALYHYCSDVIARAIMDDDFPALYSGQGSHFGWGVYATDIEPVDSQTWEEVSTYCFGGEAAEPELSWCFVVHRGVGEQQFEQVAPSEWVIQCAAPNELVEADLLFIEVRRWDGERWVGDAAWDGSEWVSENE